MVPLRIFETHALIKRKKEKKKEKEKYLSPGALWLFGKNKKDFAQKQPQFSKGY